MRILRCLLWPLPRPPPIKTKLGLRIRLDRTGVVVADSDFEAPEKVLQTRGPGDGLRDSGCGGDVGVYCHFGVDGGAEGGWERRIGGGG
jgi:hypothetical protein